MNAEQIKQAREIIAAASPGPWPTIPSIDYDTENREGLGSVWSCGPIHNFNFETEAKEQSKARADQDFIAAARTLLPAALGEIESLRAFNAAIIAERDKLRAVAEAAYAFTSIVTNRIDAVFYERDLVRMQDALKAWRGEK